MASRRDVKESRKKYYELRLRDVLIAKREPCVNCGEKDINGHYVPPSFGEPGFYSCKEKK
jgi:hypothetical protein